MKTALNGILLAILAIALAACEAPSIVSGGDGGQAARPLSVDRTNPEQTAAGIAAAYKAKDLDAIARYIPPAYERQRADFEAKREDSEIYQVLYAEEEEGWQYLADWGATPPPARQDRDRRLYPLRAVGTEMFALALTKVDGRWYVEDVYSPDLDRFNSLPFAE